MTRKDFTLIATQLNDALIKAGYGTEEDEIFVKDLIHNFADALYDANPRFLYPRFYEACGLDGYGNLV